jgi:hypothetical protein
VLELLDDTASSFASELFRHAKDNSAAAGCKLVKKQHIRTALYLLLPKGIASVVETSADEIMAAVEKARGDEKQPKQPKKTKKQHQQSGASNA